LRRAGTSATAAGELGDDEPKDATQLQHPPQLLEDRNNLPVRDLGERVDEMA
jgi:hypothetical protein